MGVQLLFGDDLRDLGDLLGAKAGGGLVGGLDDFLCGGGGGGLDGDVLMVGEGGFQEGEFLRGELIQPGLWRTPQGSGHG